MDGDLVDRAAVGANMQLDPLATDARQRSWRDYRYGRRRCNRRRRSASLRGVDDLHRVAIRVRVE
jgi:hypothetical protein